MFWRRKRKDSPTPESTPDDGGDSLPPELSDTLHLARGAQQGDGDAWLHLDEKIRPWMERTLARRSLPRGHDAQDVIQEVLLYVHQRFDKFEVQPDATFRGWVLQILEHKLVDLWRRTGAQKRGAGAEQLLSDGEADLAADDGDRPSVHLRAREIEEGLRDMSTKLRPKHRMVLELREEQELSYQDIAEKMGYPNVATVRTLLRRARISRRELMARFDEGGTADKPE